MSKVFIKDIANKPHNLSLKDYTALRISAYEKVEVEEHLITKVIYNEVKSGRLLIIKPKAKPVPVSVTVETQQAADNSSSEKVTTKKNNTKSQKNNNGGNKNG